MYSQVVAIFVALGFVAGGNITSRTLSDDTGDGLALVSHGTLVLPSTVPWHAGIYIKNGSGHVQWCGGTLVADDLVVSAAHCFWDLRKKAPMTNPDLFKVTLGKVYREYNSSNDEMFVQRFAVEEIILHGRFIGYVDRQLAYDIALIKLASKANFSEFVQAAAVDVLPGPPANGSVGVVAGWGLTETGNASEVLRSILLPYVDHTTCYNSLGEDRFKRLLTFDMFCAGFSNQGKSVCQGDSGGGYVVKDNITNTATLRGVVSVDFRPSEFSRDRCYNLHYTGFTNVGEPSFLELINSYLYPGPRSPCPAYKNTTSVLVTLCQHNYKFEDCSRPTSAGTVAILQCPQGYRFLEGDTTYVICLKNGVWSQQRASCVRVVTCPALTPTAGQIITCFTGTHIVSCSTPAAVGTTAVVGCDPRYRSVNAAGHGLVSKCQEQGDWSLVLSTCAALDPCMSKQCGPHSACSVVNTLAVCSCMKNYFGSPPECRPECLSSTDCAQDKACLRQRCVDPCIGACTSNARCKVDNHNAGCTCLEGYTGANCTEPDCGRPRSRQMVIDGETLQSGIVPWHVYIYGHRSGHRCVGTLITPTRVIAAANCVTTYFGMTATASQLTLVAGQQLRDSRGELDEQRRGVVSVTLHPQYTGESDTLAHNVGILVATFSFTMTWAVNTACMDWSNQYTAPNSSNIIIVASWRRGTITHLKVSAVQSFTFVPYSECVKSADFLLRSSITEDKFCARPINDVTCKEYQGTGLLVMRTTTRGPRYFLTGVYSQWLARSYNSDAGCYTNRLLGFTSISEQLDWIQQQVHPTERHSV